MGDRRPARVLAVALLAAVGVGLAACGGSSSGAQTDGVPLTVTPDPSGGYTDGQTITFSYDSGGRLSSIALPANLWKKPTWPNIGPIDAI